MAFWLPYALNLSPIVIKGGELGKLASRCNDCGDLANRCKWADRSDTPPSANDAPGGAGNPYARPHARPRRTPRAAASEAPAVDGRVEYGRVRRASVRRLDRGHRPGQPGRRPARGDGGGVAPPRDPQDRLGFGLRAADDLRTRADRADPGRDQHRLHMDVPAPVPARQPGDVRGVRADRADR